MIEDCMDASGVRQTVTELRMTGESLTNIAERRMIPAEVMRALISGRDKTGAPVSEIAYRHYESLVKAPIPPTRLPEFPEQRYDGMVLPFGTIRRLRSLVALGHSHAYLARRLGGAPESEKSLIDLMDPWKTGQVSANLAVTVSTTHRTLRLFDGTNEAWRVEGKLRGWDIWQDADPDDFDRVEINDYGYIENDPAV
ncbi:hypothetical protein [Mycobacteroides abscessus]